MYYVWSFSVVGPDVTGVTTGEVNATYDVTTEYTTESHTGDNETTTAGR